MTADEAMRAIESDMCVYVHANSAYPSTLLEAMTRRAPHLRNVEVMHLIGFGEPHYNRPEFADSFRHNALFVGHNMRQAVKDGRADFIPIHLHEVEPYFVQGIFHPDVALIHVSTPDRHGFVSLGVAVETTLTAARYSRHVIAQVNRQMPRTFGHTFLHVSELSAIVEVDEPLYNIAPEPVTDVHRAIARHAASLVEDGSCVQFGIGAIPSAIPLFLSDRRHLGVHSETLTESAIPLLDAGVITGSRKQIDRHKIVIGFVLGTREWYQYVDDNPLFEFRPSGYVNDPWIIAQNDNVVSINSAIEIDLTGQVCSDSIGPRVISGFGGQVDFVRGANRSRNGKSIIAIPSTALEGKQSRIVPLLRHGAGVVTTRADVHYVITEYGIASLHGKNLRQRAEALLQIAHPTFRAELEEALRNMKWGPRAPPPNVR
jgi:acyl-CoA hydrolase